MCTPWPYVKSECLSAGRGLLPREFDHLKSQLADIDAEHAELDAVHAEHAVFDAVHAEHPVLGAVHAERAVLDAVHAEHAQHAEQAMKQEEHFKLTSHVVEVEAMAELAELQNLKHEPLILLDDLIHMIFDDTMADEEAKYASFSQECTVLNTAEFTAMFDVDGNRDDTKPMEHLGWSHRPSQVKKGRLHRRTRSYSQPQRFVLLKTNSFVLHCYTRTFVHIYWYQLYILSLHTSIYVSLVFEYLCSNIHCTAKIT